MNESKLTINSRLYCPWCPPNKGDMYVRDPDEALKELDDCVLQYYCKTCKTSFSIEMWEKNENETIL